MDPNHRDRIAFVRLCSGKLTRGMKVKQVRTGKVISLHAPQFFFAQDRALAEEALCRRRGRHSQSRHAAHRRHADRRRGPQLRRRAELRAGDPAPRSPARRHEGQEAQAGAAGTGGGGRGAGVPADRRLARAGRRGRPAAARRAAARGSPTNTAWRSTGTSPSSSSRAGSRPTTARCSTSSWRATARPSPRTSTAISSSWRATPSISTTPASRTAGITFTDVKDIHKKKR